MNRASELRLLSQLVCRPTASPDRTPNPVSLLAAAADGTAAQLSAHVVDLDLRPSKSKWCIWFWCWSMCPRMRSVCKKMVHLPFIMISISSLRFFSAYIDVAVGLKVKMHRCKHKVSSLALIRYRCLFVLQCYLLVHVDPSSICTRCSSSTNIFLLTFTFLHPVCRQVQHEVITFRLCHARVRF